jgi:hypothetical protein
MSATTTNLTLAAAAAAALSITACGGRPEAWSQPVGQTVFGLATSVAVVDAPANRVVTLRVKDATSALQVGRVPTGHGIAAIAAAPDGSRLYVLTAGHHATLGDTQPAEAPKLAIIQDDGTPGPTIDLHLTEPLDGLIVDDTGRWAVVYAATAGTTALVTNPNAIVIVDLTTGLATPRTLHSFGGRPERLMFTPALTLPSGAHQLLIVQSEQDLALLVLDGGAGADEITVRLADAAAVGPPRRPDQIVVDDGDPATTDDARVGIRFGNDTSVMTLQLAPAAGANGFSPVVNVADVGGLPSDIAFVRTDGGLRLAALVPSVAQAVLVDPVTTITTVVNLPAPYQRLSLVTAAAGGGGGPDLALLWLGAATGSGVAFWELGQAAGRPFRSIETVGVSGAVSGVLDVPLAGAALKVLDTARGGTFYVLDLATRTAAPLITSASSVELSVSRTGQRVWTFAMGGTELASTDVVTKDVRTLHADSPIAAVFEIGRAGDTGRTLLALHGGGALGATIYDVAAGDDTNRRIYGGLLEEGPYENR